MPIFTTDGTDRLEARQVPPRTLGTSINRTMDRNLAVANWCGGDVRDNESGIWFPKEDTRYARPGNWIVKVANGFVVWQEEAFVETFEKVSE